MDHKLIAQLVHYDKLTIDGVVFAQGSVILPKGCTSIVNDIGVKFTGHLTRHAEGSVEFTFCVQEKDAVELIQKVLDTPPAAVGCRGFGVTVDVIKSKFWGWVFSWKPAQKILWFIFKRVERIKVVDKYNLISVDLISVK